MPRYKPNRSYVLIDTLNDMVVNHIHAENLLEAENQARECFKDYTRRYSLAEIVRPSKQAHYLEEFSTT